MGRVNWLLKRINNRPLPAPDKSTVLPWGGRMWPQWLRKRKSPREAG